MSVHGIFTYAVDERGRLTGLRGYWALADASFERGSAEARDGS
jgi:hypothetical protein